MMTPPRPPRPVAVTSKSANSLQRFPSRTKRTTSPPTSQPSLVGRFQPSVARNRPRRSQITLWTCCLKIWANLLRVSTTCQSRKRSNVQSSRRALTKSSLISTPASLLFSVTTLPVSRPHPTGSAVIRSWAFVLTLRSLSCMLRRFSTKSKSAENSS